MVLWLIVALTTLHDHIYSWRALVRHHFYTNLKCVHFNNSITDRSIPALWRKTCSRTVLYMCFLLFCFLFILWGKDFISSSSAIYYTVCLVTVRKNSLKMGFCRASFSEEAVVSLVWLWTVNERTAHGLFMYNCLHRWILNKCLSCFSSLQFVLSLMVVPACVQNSIKSHWNFYIGLLFIFWLQILSFKIMQIITLGIKW